ncbi:nicotinamidase/pyrazinamidase [Pseudovibrio axinellae]|uniref:Nicotinamidase/pyrazinamidase n=1 Tax=Pseudovibrio axinellae TaxID=989403 RepID=A0A165TVS2_9HYPH|nr:isochorismatase family protein [Pseudovibrio axinellae]KZL06691.1 nicotinamidase/pyrazinamidase [Pseudovibrio axinellae]SER60851.1 Nicotinamidase-related amidase [Pseudovibrio axinellae]
MEIWFGVALLLLVGLGYSVLRRLRVRAQVRRGAVERNSQNKTALLVIDVQDDFTKSTPKRQWPEGYVEDRLVRINGLVEDARRQGQPVIVIRQIFKGAFANSVMTLLGEGLGTRKSDGLGLDPRLAFEADAEFIKHVGDAFSNPALGAFLKIHKVGRLRLTGLDGCYCVKSTALGALRRGYVVDLEQDALLSINQKAWLKCRDEIVAKGAHLVSSKAHAVA